MKTSPGREDRERVSVPRSRGAVLLPAWAAAAALALGTSACSRSATVLETSGYSDQRLAGDNGGLGVVPFYELTPAGPKPAFIGFGTTWYMVRVR